MTNFPNRIQFQQNQSQNGRPPVNNDYISALHFYGSYPSGGSFNSGNQTIPFLSLIQAENAGIVNTNIDATAATATYEITAIGTANSTIITLTVTNPLGVKIVLCSYTQLTADSSATLLGASIAAAINANTPTTGYSASSTTGTLTITAPKSLGIYLNSAALLVPTITNTGSFEATLTDFSGGVASILAVWHYHISEYFRMMPNGKVYVTITPSYSSSFNDILAAQAFAQGAIRQFGVYQPGATATSTAYKAVISAASIVRQYLQSINQPAVIYLGMDIVGGIIASPNFADMSDMPDLSGLNCPGIGAVVGQDGAAVGANLFYSYGYSITTLGATLGTTSSAAVNEDIGWVGEFNITDGTELNVPAFANGQLYSTVFSSENNVLTQLDNYRYNFIMTYSGYVGTYFNDDKTATSSTNSYANMNDNRTIDKVQRGVYAALLPLVNGPLTLNSNGTLTNLQIATISNQAFGPMEDMSADGELATLNQSTAVSIDASQNVVQNNGITVAVTPTENGTARIIYIPIGYAN